MVKIPYCIWKNRVSATSNKIKNDIKKVFKSTSFKKRSHTVIPGKNTDFNKLKAKF